MIVVFESIDELNAHYARVLSELDEINKNVNEDTAKVMLKNLMKEYDANLELLRKNEKFQKKILRMKEKMYQKNVKLDTKFECKKMKYTMFRKWWMNFKFYREFKKKCKLEFDKKLVADKKEIMQSKMDLKSFYEEMRSINTKKLEAQKNDK